MKKWIITTSLCLCSLLMATEQTTVNLEEIEGPELMEFSEGNRPDLIIAIEEGSIFPLDLLATGEILSLSQENVVSVTLKKTLFIKCERKEQFLISHDGTDFRNFSEFFTGGLSAGYGKSDENPEMKVDLRLEVNQRKPKPQNGIVLD